MVVHAVPSGSVWSKETREKIIGKSFSEKLIDPPLSSSMDWVRWQARHVAPSSRGLQSPVGTDGWRCLNVRAPPAVDQRSSIMFTVYCLVVSCVCTGIVVVWAVVVRVHNFTLSVYVSYVRCAVWFRKVYRDTYSVLVGVYQLQQWSFPDRVASATIYHPTPFRLTADEFSSIRSFGEIIYLAY